MRHDSLGRAAGDLFTFVQLFRDAPDTARPAIEQLKPQIVQLLDTVVRSPVANALDPQEVEAARFALVVWIDETILSSSWSGRDRWGAELLQMEIFRTNTGGDEFYRRLNGLTPDQNQAREIFYLCLIAGFEGAMYDRASERQALKGELYETLRVAGLARDAASERYLSTSAYNLAIEVSGSTARGIGPAVAAWLAGTALAFGLFVLALWLLAGGVDLPPEY